MTPRILLAIPIYEAVKPLAYFHHIAFHRHVGVASAEGRYKCTSKVIGPRKSIRLIRNDSVRVAIEVGATHLMFLDDDILPPANLIDLLLAVDKPIVGAVVRRSDGVPIVFRGGVDGEVPWIDHPKSGAFECWAIGTGAILIATEVFARLRAPWFRFDETERTMDVNFCRSAQAAGIPIWCSADAASQQLVHRDEAI